MFPKWVKEQRRELKALLGGGGGGKNGAIKTMRDKDVTQLTWDRYMKLERLGFQFVPDPEKEVRCEKPWSFCTCDMEV